MVKSRLDLYRAGDEAIENDPAYDFQNYPDVSLQPNVTASTFRPSEEPAIEKLRELGKDIGKVAYGQPGGYPDPADLFQGLGRLLLPGQKALTPEDEKNLIGVQLENAMAKKAEERIRPEVEALGKPARFTEPEIARRVYEDIGGRDFSRPKAFLQDIQTPVLSSVQDLAEGRPIYDFSPIELTDLVFSVIDQIDVALGTKGIVGGTARAIRAGLSVGTRALLDALERAPSKAAQEEIVRRDPKNALQLKQELDELNIKIQQKDTTEDLTEELVEEQTGFSLADPELRDVRFATGKPKEFPKTTAQRPKAERSGTLLEPSAKAGYKTPESAKIVNAEADLWDAGAKFKSRDDFVKAVEKKSGVKNLTTTKIRAAKDYHTRKGNINFGVKRLEYAKGTNEDGLYPFREPSLTEETKKLINYIKKNKDKIEPGSLKQLSTKFGASYDRIQREFPELLYSGTGVSKFTQQAATAAKKRITVENINRALELKADLQKQYPRLDLSGYNTLKKELDALGYQIPDGKVIKRARDEGLITEETFRSLVKDKPGSLKVEGTGDQIEDVLNNAKLSAYEQASQIVQKLFGKTISTGNQKLLLNSIRRNPKRVTKELRDQGAMTNEEFLNSGLKDIYGDRASYNKSLLGDQSPKDLAKKGPNIMTKRMQDDIKAGMDYNDPLFKITAETAQEANLVMRDYFKKLFLDETSDPKLLKFRDQFVKEFDRAKGSTTDLSNVTGQNKFLSDLKNAYGAQLSHTMPASRSQGAEIADRVENIKINSAAHNLQLQVKTERRMNTQLRNIQKALTRGDMQVATKLADTIKTFDEIFKKRNMAGAYYVNKDQVVDFLKSRGLNADNNMLFIGTEKRIGSIEDVIDEAQDVLTYTKNYFDKLIQNPEQIKFYEAQLGRKTKDKSKRGLEQEIRKGMPNSDFANDPFEFKKGGPVKMAIGGDPLTNLNQQQFSPDPAFEGQDFFQEAVDSGNLQAVNLLRLFDVFKKPKVMATPSNVKQVEQARDPMPTPTGGQELQPLPAGKPDFFFKSFLLDQLNLPNAPKASTPQGWREFLIKGKKVPEAEMLDTGILQYLEDTEKFYPNKKITKQELEDLYDTSPLGNLEVRVKQTEPPIDRQGNLDFLTDQGRPKHRNAGNARIDEQADEYFEVVVNVPTLPGQETAFVNSAHFSEPNVLGFTRVGTYKNSNNETVAVIQEMQTDMLTEVRKEQERLFSMINALKRRRAQLVDQAQNSTNPEYYKNELRLFDQKYPPAKLDALETDNLIQPFPNVVAKDLIPERTASLNSIQEQINKLIMANVEQYNDPAYKTMVFDLAQQQNKIFEDLNSMNRSANYEEGLQNFKVPSTADRDELSRIAYSDEYLPSDYQLKQVTSFPPIPFNKQADYVDLLIKSTIKAAKGKGIDKVAIMPANVGANPRWGKSGDEAKKKFENLYDKVGVQQLKNIAKKYGGTLQVEKIIDPSKSGKGLTFFNKNPDGEFQILKQTELRRDITSADADKYYDGEIKKIASGVTEPGEIVYSKEIAPGQIMDYYIVEGRGDATDVGYRMIPLKEGQNVDDAMIKITEYKPNEIDMYTISFDPSQLEEPMYLFKKKSGGSIDKDSLVSITDIYGEYGR